jgi:hypothetical protein
LCSCIIDIGRSSFGLVSPDPIYLKLILKMNRVNKKSATGIANLFNGISKFFLYGLFLFIMKYYSTSRTFGSPVRTNKYRLFAASSV